MIMRKFALLLVMVLITCYTGHAQGVEFTQGTWEEVLAKAKSENKYVFVDVYTQWCGPCKYVSNEIFPQKKLGDYYNVHFLNFKMDAESEEGKEFVKKYPVKAYPTFLFIDETGKVINRFVGARDVDGFMREAEMVAMYARHGGIDNMMKQIENGTASKSMLYDYYLYANERQKPIALNLYLKSLSFEELMNPEHSLVEKISLYDKELTTRLIDDVIKVQRSEKRNDKDFFKKFEFNIVFSIQRDMTLYIREAIKQGNEEWLNELLNLKERFAAYDGWLLDGDLKIVDGRGEFFATPEYIRLCFMSYNRVKEEEFKTMVVDYMTDLIAENPVDTLLKDNGVIKHLRRKEMKYNENTEYFVRQGEVTIHNIIVWTDYFWRISSSSKKIKRQCVEWIDYAFHLNPYIFEPAIEATDLLVRLGKPKVAENILEVAIQNQKEIGQPDEKVFRTLELKLQDLRNGKL